MGQAGPRCRLAVRGSKPAGSGRGAQVGKRDRPAKKGERLPRLAQIAEDPQTAWEQTEITRDGKRRTVDVHRFQALFYDVWGERPIQVVLVRERERTTGYDVALISMNMHASPAQIIEIYDERWSIEVSIESATQITGVGEARNRVKRAVERTVPLGLLCQSLVICWYALHGQAKRDVKRRRWLSPWYPHKRTPSLQDMLTSLRREVIAAQYPPLTPPHNRPATNPKLPASAGHGRSMNRET